jgi:hypothetical protein
MRDASGQKAKTRESVKAHASNRIQPFPLATLPISYLRRQTFPAKIRPSKGERWNNTTIEIKTSIKTCKYSK